MEQSSARRGTTVAAERACVSERILAFLRARYPVKMAEHVAADVGISAAAIRKLEERGSAPSLAVFTRMARAYGSDFVFAVLGWDWLDHAAGWERQRALEASIAAQTAELARVRRGRP